MRPYADREARWARFLNENRLELALLALLWYGVGSLLFRIAFAVTHFDSIYNCMNMTLPLGTRALLSTCSILWEGSVVLGPLLAVGATWLLGVLPLRTMVRIWGEANPARAEARRAWLFLLLAGGAAASFAAGKVATSLLYLPMVRLVNNVG